MQSGHEIFIGIFYYVFHEIFNETDENFLGWHNPKKRQADMRDSETTARDIQLVKQDRGSFQLVKK